MNWQDYAVAAIGGAIVVAFVVHLVRAIKKRKDYNPCANCPQADCLSKKNPKSKREEHEHLSR